MWKNAFGAYCRVIKVRGQVKGNKIVSYLKTDAAYREVDLCPEVAELLKNYVGSRRGLLFSLEDRGNADVLFERAEALAPPEVGEAGTLTRRVRRCTASAASGQPC